jgi:hypothetical protein
MRNRFLGVANRWMRIVKKNGIPLDKKRDIIRFATPLAKKTGIGYSIS